MSTGERQEWMETLQTATRPPACGSQKPSDSLSHPSSTNKRGLLELRGYKGRVLVSLAGSKVRLCKTEQVLLTPLGLPLYRMTASCLKKRKIIITAYLKQNGEAHERAGDIHECVMEKSKYICVKMLQGLRKYNSLSSIFDEYNHMVAHRYSITNLTMQLYLYRPDMEL